ncbi:MAG: chromate resistance protein ChrB domain-containing protein [Promethearchaeota archaeon]
MLWTTRDYVHVDRVACPWLIRRFIDLQAQFVFLPRDQITEFVEKTGAIPFDTGTGIELDHYEENGIKNCTFDAIVKKYNLSEDAALAELQKIVRAADTSGGLKREPMAWLLEVIASGMPLLCNSDHEALEKEFPMYDGFYAYMQREIIFKKFADEIKAFKSRGERREFIKQKMRELPSLMKK